MEIIATMLAVTWLNPHVYLDTLLYWAALAGSLTLNRNVGLRRDN